MLMPFVSKQYYLYKPYIRNSVLWFIYILQTTYLSTIIFRIVKGNRVSKTSYSNMKCLLLNAALVLNAVLGFVAGDQRNGEYFKIYTV